MDDFDDTFGDAPSNGNGVPDSSESDPAAEFLAREQDNLAGLEDEIPAAITNEISGDINEDIINGHGGDVGNDFLAQDDRPPSPPAIPIQREEPEKLRIWREEQNRRLEVKDQEEEETKIKLRESAKKELEDWYKNYDEQIIQTRNSNRNAEQEGVVADASPTDANDGKEWERIANLCDFNPKASKQQKDISRMRSLILQLKQNPPPRLQQPALKNGFGR